MTNIDKSYRESMTKVGYTGLDKVSDEAIEVAKQRHGRIVAKQLALQENQPDSYKKWLKEKNERFTDSNNNIGKKLSYEMAKKYDTVIKACHDNTLRIAFKNSELPPEEREDLRVFFGLYTCDVSVPVSHSWFVTSSGLVIDPTLAIPCKPFIKEDGTNGYQFEGQGPDVLEPKDSNIYQNKNAVYVGVEMPLDLIRKMYRLKLDLVAKWNGFQHRWLQEFYLISELGYSVDEAILHTGEGEEGNDSWQTMFEMLIDAKT